MCDDEVWLVKGAQNGALMGNMNLRYFLRLMPVDPPDV